MTNITDGFILLEIITSTFKDLHKSKISILVLFPLSSQQMAKCALKFEHDLDQAQSIEETKPQKLKLILKRIKSTESHTTVEGAIIVVSPSKDNSSFFNGEITDGYAVIRGSWI